MDDENWGDGEGHTQTTANNLGDAYTKNLMELGFICEKSYKPLFN